MSAPGERGPSGDPLERQAQRTGDEALPRGESPARQREDRQRNKPPRKPKRAWEERDAQGHLVGTIQPPRRHRLRKWLLRLAIAAAAILLIGFIAIQIILHTAMPRNLVVSALQKQFGLRIAAQKMSTGWLGHTRLDQVTLALPLASESFLEVPQLKVDHTNLIALLFKRPLVIHAIELDQPKLMVKQDPLGRWNVEEAFALITRASGGKSAAEQQQQGGPVQLPSLTVKNGTVVLVDNQGKKTNLAPLNVTGRPESPVAWTFAATAPHLDIKGRVAPGQNWEHVVDFSIDQVNQVLAPWFADAPSPMRLSGQWHGTAAGNRVDGRADLKQSQVGPVALSGAVGIQEGDGVATLTPQTLVANVSGVSDTPVQFTSGSFKMSGTRIEAQQVHIGAMGGAARIDGTFDWHTRTGNIDAAWTDMLGPGHVRHGGTIKGSIDMPWAGRPQIKAAITTSGYAQQRKWNGDVQVLGSGRSWSDIDWTVQVPRLAITGPRHTGNLQDLVLQITTRNSDVRLTSMSMAQTDRARGFGAYNLAKKDWWVWLDLKQMDLPRFTRPVDLLVQASGTSRRIDITQLEWMAGKSHVWVNGSYEFSRPKPLDATVFLWRLPLEAADPQRILLPAGSAGLRGQARAIGTVLPLDVDLDGELFGNQVYFGKRQLGDLAVRMTSHLGENVATFRSTQLKLLEGEWDISGQYLYDEQWGSLDLGVRDLSLHQFDAFVEPPPNAQGKLHARIHLEWPHQKREEMTVTGDWAIDNLKKGTFVAQKAAGKINMQDDQVTVAPIVLHQGNGQLQGSLKYSMNSQDHLALDAAATDWPIDLPSARGSLQVSAQTRLDINLKDKSATGPLKLSAAARLYDRDLGTARVDAQMRGHELQLLTADASAFGGTFHGQGAFALDDWTKSTGKFDFQGIDSASIVQMWPSASGLAGIFNGSIELRPNFEPHATEPLVADIHARPIGARFNGASIKGLDLTFTAGKERLVLSQGVLSAADGVMTAWARLSKHGPTVIGHIQLELHSLNVDQLVHAFSATARTTPGLVDGEITVFGPIRHKDQISGEARLNFTRMQLLNLDLLTSIYNAINPSGGPPPAQGRGSAYLRLEQGTLSLVNGFYRNQGIYLRMQAQLKNIFDGANSPISGFAVGTARPLSQLKLPFFAQVDDIVSALQHAVTTFRLAGTAGHPRLEPAGFNEVGDALKSLFVTDVREQVQGSAGR